MNETNDARQPPSAAPSTAAPPALPRPARRRRWVSLLLSLVLFGSGFLVGGAGALLVVRHRVLEAIQHPELAPRRLAVTLQRALRLSDRQTEQVRGILRARQTQLQAIRARVQPEVEAELAAVEREIGDVLDAQQRTRWESMVQKFRETWLPPMPAENTAALPKEGTTATDATTTAEGK